MSAVEIFELVIICIIALFALLFTIMLFLVGVSFIIEKIDDIKSEIRQRKEQREKEEQLKAIYLITEETKVK